MKVLVTGANGQLGYDLIKELNKRNIENIGVDKNDFDITNQDETENFILNCKPDAIIHCAAYTNVNKAEDEKDLCYKINVDGTKNIASACKKIDAKMIYISTDYIFDGKKNSPYEIDDNPNPLNFYGKTKLDGENIIKNSLEKYFIVRISWVFGKNGNNFVKTMLNLSQTQNELNIVSDQIGSPTYTVDLSKILCDMILTGKYGIYHATNENYCSWYEFAQEIFKISDIKIKLNPVKTKDFPSKAKRALNSRLSKKKLPESNFSKLPTWQNALARFLKEI